MNGEILSILHIRNRLISSHSDGTIKVWDTGKRAPRLIQETREHSKAVTCLYVPPSCDKLYSGSLDKTIRVWSIKQEEIHCIRVHDVKEAVLVLTANASVACYSSQGNGVKVYNWSSVPKHVNFNRQVKCLALEGDKLYCGCSGYSIQEVDLRTYTSSTFYSGTKKLLGKQTIYSVQIHNGILFAGGSSVDGIAGKDLCQLVWTFSTRLITSLASDADGQKLFAATSEGKLKKKTYSIPTCLEFGLRRLMGSSNGGQCVSYVQISLMKRTCVIMRASDDLFGPEDESFRPYTGGKEKSCKNSLADWNSRDPARLLSLIIELRDAYKAYQRKRIEEIDDDRLKFEISTMLAREGIEMYMSSVLDKPEEVKFAVPLLDMDLNKLVAGSTWKHPQKIYLQVIFPVGKKYSTAPPPPRLKLVSSAELKALFSIEDFRLPPWVDGMCTAEYLLTLEEMLESQIKDAVSSVETRRKFIMALATHFGRPIEADPVFCRRATFLASAGVFTFLVHLSFSLQFPKYQPTLILQSSQHFNSQGVPIKSPNLTEYPWSPRWEPSEMADRISDFLADECLNFKKHCNQLNQQ
ncbi:hypothetical protein BUALT_Bualt08G0084600 [Buddleja alternifolia]|uniref:BRISC and BRCA1-A complex member 2 n=1 Tax=Buddleja alternifolia TaxID=168488 RepID=A0AAV6XD48_9LAMI|nr:hypothetical protein BUALT_Bualt08G0084600 [Buddleja alternifolia]